MGISIDQIDLWRQAPNETEVLEFKEAKSQFDTQNLLGYCVAIGNEGGGHLLLGIQNKPPRMIVGSKAIDNPGGMSEKIFNKLHFRVHIEAVMHPHGHPHGRVVVITIPPCPAGSPFHLDGAYLMRVGESVQPMTPEQLRRKFAEGNPEWTDEPARSGIGTAAVLSLLDTETFFKLMDIPYPSNNRAIIDRLLQEKFIDEEVSTASFSISRLAAILIAKDLGAFEDLERRAPRVIEYGGTSKVDSPRSDTTGRKGYASSFQRLVRFICTRLPRKEVIQDALRREIWLVPEIAIRELLANALIHQDFSVTGSTVTVEIYSNRVEISNPGTPVISTDRFIDSYKSRNERLANVMRRMRICEERGSGIDKLVNAAEEFDLAAPQFRVAEERTIVTVFGPQSFDQMGREARVRAAYQHCTLKYLKSEYMTNQSLRRRFRLPERRSGVIWKVISAATEAGHIKQDDTVGDSRKFARYVPHWC